MSQSVRVQDMMPDEIAELLAAEDCDLIEGQALARQEFIEHIGGIENAYNAVEILRKLDMAA